jgi:type I restriction enzyme R subunit
MPAYEAIAEKFDNLELLREIAPTYQSVNDLEQKQKRNLYKPLKIDASDECIAILH